MQNCVFCKIRDGEIPKKFEYQDEHIMIFPDINPAKSVHILIIPKKHIEDFLDLKDNEILKRVKKGIDMMVKKEKLENAGYRVLVNGGGAQIVDHLHFHLLGPMGKNASI